MRETRLGALRRRAVIRFGKKIRPLLDRILLRYSLVSDSDVFDVAEFPWVEEITADWTAIRREFVALDSHRDLFPQLTSISRDHAKIADDGWTVFFLEGYGKRGEFTRALCPETSRLLDRIPNLYNAFFSILSPGIHIPRHRGVTKGFIAWHLGVIVPEPSDACFMKLDDRTCVWGEGESLVFDDTRHHEVWNRSDGERVVLLMNFLRPMRWPGRLLLKTFLAVMSRTRWVTDGHDNHDAWERSFAAAVREREGARVEAA